MQYVHTIDTSITNITRYIGRSRDRRADKGRAINSANIPDIYRATREKERENALVFSRVDTFPYRETAARVVREK